MKILILGASSYVGARLYVELKNEYEVVGTYSTHKLRSSFIELDITNKNAVIELITTQKPDIIIHAANNASRVWCDEHPAEATKVNQTATSYIVEVAKEIKAKLIYISTFGVLVDTEYGRTKKASEDIIISSGIEYCILRPSLILGYSPNTTNDRPFNRILKNIDEGIPAKYDSSWKFQPTSLAHLSSVIKETIKRNIFGHTIFVSSPELTSRYQIGKDILAPFGILVEEVNAHDETPPAEAPLNKLKELDLPELRYTELVEGIVNEIKHREDYSL